MSKTYEAGAVEPDVRDFSCGILTRAKRVLSLVGPGATGGFISSICCLLPALALAAGLSGGLATTLVGLGRFRTYGIVVGLVFVIAASWFSLRRSRSCCAEQEYRRRQIVVPLTMFVSFGVGYWLLTYLVVPLIYKGM